jgi:ParB/RepB/Spo0J family partition protein
MARTKSRASRSAGLSPQAIGVKLVTTSDLHPNPHNPRRLFDKAPLEVLKNSVDKVGILVPLTVYRERKRGRYVILDGQRRWMVATQLGLPKVPVNQVAEPSLVQNIVTMFQIHQLREDWELMPSALKLEVLMKEMKERNEGRLAALTGLDKAVVARCKKLLSYPKRYQDMMLDPDPAKRVRADFFIELYPVRNDRLVNSMEWYERDKFTNRMLARYKDRKGIKAVTDFRVIKQHITNARRTGGDAQRQMKRRLKQFVEDDAKGIDYLAIQSAGRSAEARQITTEVERLVGRLRGLKGREYYGEEKLWRALERLMAAIRRLFNQVDRRTPR